MESSRPLQIIGVLASLIVLTYALTPIGRTNLGSFVRQQSFKKPPAAPVLTGPHSDLLHRIDIATASQFSSNSNSLQANFAAAQIAIDSNDPILIGITSRSLFIPNTTSNEEDVRYLEKLAELAESGSKLDPANSFFWLQGAAVAIAQEKIDSTKAFVAKAATCQTYRDFSMDEAELRKAAIPFKPTVLENQTATSMVMFPNLSNYISLSRNLVADVPPSQNIQLRLQIAQIGSLLAQNGSTTNQYVGRSIVSIATQTFKSEITPTARPADRIAHTYTPDQLDAEAVKQGIQTNNFFQRANEASTTKYGLSEKTLKEWQSWIKIAPLILSFVPFVVVGFLLLLITMPTWLKAAKNDWIRPIRYLTTVPLALPIVMTAHNSNVYFQIAVMTVIVSIPFALFTLTERYIPLVHLLTVTSAIYIFYSGSNLNEVILGVTLSSAYTLLTWHKNRTTPPKQPRTLSFSLTFIYAVIFGLSITVSQVLMSILQPVSISMNSATVGFGALITLIIGALGLVETEKSELRVQSNVIASVGLAFLLVGCYTSLRLPEELRRFQVIEENATEQGRLAFTEVLNENISSNKSANPNVIKGR